MAFDAQHPVLGTPESDGALRVLLLGAGELGKEVILELQRLGVEVIAADRYAGAPGHAVAHHARVLDMSDPQALRALIAKEKPHLIVPEIEAIATEVLAEVESAGDAVVIPTARAAQLTMNREGIRRLAAETLGLATSRYAFADSLEELQAEADAIGYPCIIKPVMSSSGKGQSTAHNAEEVAKCWDYAMSGGRVNRGRVIVEQRVEFEYEITQLTVRALNADGDVETHFCDPIGHRQEQGDYVESWQPQPMSALALQRSREIAGAVTGALGGLGIFGVELFIRGDEVWFSEVSPRPHDTGLVTLVTQRQSEFSLHARSILGLPVDVRRIAAGASAVIYGGVEARGVSYHGVAQALRTKDTDLRLFGKPEAFMRRRMGVALAHAPLVEDADAETIAKVNQDCRTRAKAAAAQVEVVAKET
jgi:phosphoribosylglycinamide formyltransferase 2